MTIRAPPTGQSVTTTGSPIPIASNMELDMPSKSDDDTNIVHGRSCSKMLVANPGKRTLSVNPKFAIC